MIESLKQQVFAANQRIVRSGLVTGTFGNVSGIDRGRGLVVIKPSGVGYGVLKAVNMVVVSVESGDVVGGTLRPSSDTPTHLVLYRAFPDIGGIVHTHSLYATAWAQARREIPALGSTHADYFNGPVPCTRPMTDEEIALDYETNTGQVIVERFADLDPSDFPAVLVANHGPFCWGSSSEEAVDHAIYTEHIARLASETLAIDPSVPPIGSALLNRHFRRKHGPAAYYGQR
ncbi:MAG: L-ribulose-5-phosphate 4-epimerase AraD [Acidobacteriota bacterium]